MLLAVRFPVSEILFPTLIILPMKFVAVILPTATPATLAAVILIPVAVALATTVVILKLLCCVLRFRVISLIDQLVLPIVELLLMVVSSNSYTPVSVKLVICPVVLAMLLRF